MSVSLTYTQTQSVSGGAYVVVNTVTASSGGIPLEVFVFDTLTNNYSHVARAADIGSWPVGPGSPPYYREATVTRMFASLRDAQNFANELPGQLQWLVNNYDSLQSAFIGTTTATVTG